MRPYKTTVVEYLQIRITAKFLAYQQNLKIRDSSKNPTTLGKCGVVMAAMLLASCSGSMFHSHIVEQLPSLMSVI